MGRLGVLDPSDTLKVLIIDSKSLHRHVCDLVEYGEDAVFATGHDEALSRLSEQQFDIVLLTVGESVFSTMITAAAMRAIERRASSLHHAAIIACTSNPQDYEDCIHSGCGLSDALNAPWTVATVHACLEQWRADKYLRGLRSKQPRRVNAEPHLRSPDVRQTPEPSSIEASTRPPPVR